MNEKIKAVIPSPNGPIEVEGTKEQIEKLLITMGVKKETRKKKSPINEQIINLIRSGFFDQTREFSEIQNELKKKGYHFVPSKIYPVLIREFIRKGILKRKGSRGSYIYFVEKEL